MLLGCKQEHLIELIILFFRTDLIKNVVAHYNVNDTEVFGCFLRAFDRVVHSVLFEKLPKRSLPTCIVRTLLTWYSSQKVTVKWNSCYTQASFLLLMVYVREVFSHL